MHRVLKKYFGADPDLDIEAQRAIVVVKKPMTFDWTKVGDLVKNASYTFAGAHLRLRGRFRVSSPPGRDSVLTFVVDSSKQEIPVKASDLARSAGEQPIEAVLRVEEWKKERLGVSLVAVATKK